MQVEMEKVSSAWGTCRRTGGVHDRSFWAVFRKPTMNLIEMTRFGMSCEGSVLYIASGWETAT